MATVERQERTAMGEGTHVVKLRSEAAGVGEQETEAIRMVAGVLRSTSRLLPQQSVVGAEMEHWATELCLAAEERQGVPEGTRRLRPAP